MKYALKSLSAVMGLLLCGTAFTVYAYHCNHTTLQFALLVLGLLVGFICLAIAISSGKHRALSELAVVALALLIALGAFLSFAHAFRACYQF